ncbi:TSUP family transporter [Halomarina rubra]|uniref:Probable membrane transporter protein n=1 Tax=Halomarina rubra TaxID=2071873 RepID=A0ABD6AU55_9EURY|nr:TSUP family transporter [Halomarina rubra]
MEYDQSTDGEHAEEHDTAVQEHVVTPEKIGVEAQQLDRRLTTAERLRIPARSLRRLSLLGLVYIVGMGLMAWWLPPFGQETSYVVLGALVLTAFVFELLDSAAGMGFGTALAPLLFILGYDPLQVTPVLLISETLTGLVSGGVHHELRNARFSIRPLNAETRLMLLLGGVGAAATLVSIVLAYFALVLPESFIKLYVSVLVLVMGVVGLVRARLVTTIEYRPRRLVAFAALAGVNKGIGGGGYGPVVTLGQILSGVYEKSAIAIAGLAESLVSIVGVLTFVLLAMGGVHMDLLLLPSIFTGGFLAAIAAPYLVRVLPNAVWRYVVPLYAFGIGLAALTIGLDI